MSRPAITIESTLNAATKRLAEVSDSPRLDAEILLAWVLGTPRSYLFTYPEAEVNAETDRNFCVGLSRRLRGEPLAHITGEKEFWSLRLNVSRDTLVPRPETETLVEQALALIPQDRPCRVLDLGTGSGAIAIAIASERPKSKIDAIDSSHLALTVAKENAAAHSIENVRFLEGNWFEPVMDERFDIIVANPPYVRDDDPALDDLSYEPRSALAAGPDGLDAIRGIARDARIVIAANGTLLLEHGLDHQSAVAAILQEHGWVDIRCFHDLAGNARVTAASPNVSSVGV
jgi:release factor glutamine methyltransferase